MFFFLVDPTADRVQIVVLTDDAHGLQRLQLKALMGSSSSAPSSASMWTPSSIDRAQEVADREADVYAFADAVATVSEALEQSLAGKLDALGVTHQTLHFSHKLIQPRAEGDGDDDGEDLDVESPGVAQRSDLLFVGYGPNPSNQAGLQWFFAHVFPLLSRYRCANLVFCVLGVSMV